MVEQVSYFSLKSSQARKNSLTLAKFCKLIDYNLKDLQKWALYNFLYKMVSLPNVDVKKMNNRIRGRILQLVVRAKSHLTLRRALLRWELNTNRKHLKKAVKAIVLHAQLNP